MQHSFCMICFQPSLYKKPPINHYTSSCFFNQLNKTACHFLSVHPAFLQPILPYIRFFTPKVPFVFRHAFMLFMIGPPESLQAIMSIMKACRNPREGIMKLMTGESRSGLLFGKKIHKLLKTNHLHIKLPQ